MKKETHTNKKSVKRKEKNKQTKEEEKEKKIEKTNRMKKEAWKTIDMLVTEGMRPFWYGFKQLDKQSISNRDSVTGCTQVPLGWPSDARLEYWKVLYNCICIQFQKS